MLQIKQVIFAIVHQNYSFRLDHLHRKKEQQIISFFRG